MRVHINPYRGFGLPGLDEIPWPIDRAKVATDLFARCPHADRTPLQASPSLAKTAGIAEIHLKDERNRMGLGSFKALGASHVIARDAEEGRAAGRTYATASAGNHGMSVAAGAAAFGANSRVYISDTVPESFARRLRGQGAEVVREGANYEDSMAAARIAADREGLELLSDSSWPGYVDRPLVLMEGYLILMAEVVSQNPDPPTHIFLQAGVGGLAAAAAAHARATWGPVPSIVVVEPEAAPALAGSVAAGRPTASSGPESMMGRLDCKEPSLIALRGLARDADAFVTISEDEARQGAAAAAAAGFATTPSGAAGLSALLASGADRQRLELSKTSRALVFLTEAPEDVS